MGSLRKLMRMRGAQVLLVLLCVNLCRNNAVDFAPRVLTSRVLRQSPSEEFDCESEVCSDCRGSCDGCSKCPLCSLIQKACDDGKELKFKGQDICRNCSYCKEGTEECKRKCEQGKKGTTCRNCLNNCPVNK